MYEDMTFFDFEMIDGYTYAKGEYSNEDEKIKIKFKIQATKEDYIITPYEVFTEQQIDIIKKAFEMCFGTED
jgi:capsule polysaccharide modification protein KpsS